MLHRIAILDEDGETASPVENLPNGNTCDSGAEDGKDESLPELNHHQDSSPVQEGKRPCSPPSVLPQQQEQPCTN